MQNSKIRKSSRLARSLSLNTEHADYNIKLEQYYDDIKQNIAPGTVQRRRPKRQQYFGSEQIRRDIAEIQQRLDEIDVILSNLTLSQNKSIDVSAIWANVSSTHEKQIELEERIDDLEKRIEATELTTAEIAEEMARTRSYLDHLKANMSKTVEMTSNDTTTVAVNEEGEKQLPPSKDLKAFQNYLKDIGEITRNDFQELGNKKEDFIVSCTWQGTICDSR